MRSTTTDQDSRLLLWLHVREFAVPPSMIELATARRAAGDWAGACAAARIDVDLDLRAVTRTHGQELSRQIRADLRCLAPDLLRWHLPRVAPDGLLRPGSTIGLARYPDPRRGGGHHLHLVVRTPPAWADAGQRLSLALWDGSPAGAGSHPHPRPDQRFRLDLHRHLWDADRSGELRTRSGADRQPTGDRDPDGLAALRDQGYAVDRWVAEARILLHAEGHPAGAVAVRLRSRQHLVLRLAGQAAVQDRAGPLLVPAGPGRIRMLPVLPEAATWTPPDLALLRAGLLSAEQLHPLVASALVPGHRPPAGPPLPQRAAEPRLVDCRGAWHRIGLVDGVLTALDHDPAEIRREELLAALTGTPLPCLRAIDEAHRHPECLDDVRARLRHGDVPGALATVEGLLGPDASVRTGALRDALDEAVRQRVRYGLFRSGLAGPRLGWARRPDGATGVRRTRRRRATGR